MSEDDRKHRVRAWIWLGLCAWVSYASALFGQFVYDDLHSVANNPGIASLANLPSFFWDVDLFSGVDARMYRPVVLVTLALDHAVGGGATLVFKHTNVWIHAINAMLLLSVLRALGVSFRPAMVACTLFAVHPMASEVVNMVSSRSDSLNALGVLLATWGYLRLQQGVGWKGLAWALLGLGIACGSKATGVILPALFLTLEFLRWLRLRHEDSLQGTTFLRECVVRLSPFVVAVVVYLWVRQLSLGVATLNSLPTLTGGDDAMVGAQRDLLTQFALMGHVLPRFLAQSVVPIGLTLDPWIPLDGEWLRAPVLAGWVAVLGLTALGLRSPRRRPVVFFGTCLAWCSAAPWVLIPLNLPACEHRFYLPLIGLTLAMGASIPPRWLEGHGDAHSRLASRSRLPQCGLVVCVLLFAGLSAARSSAFHDLDDAWSDALAGHPRSVYAVCGLALERRADAMAAHARGDSAAEGRALHRASALLQYAVHLYPRHREARQNLAEFQLALGRDRGGDPEHALEHADWLVKHHPENPFFRLLRSRVLSFGERHDEAVEAALSVLEIADPKGLVFRTAAGARERQGRIPEAIALLDRSVSLGLDHETVLLHRARLLMQQHRKVAAERDLQTVLARDPFHAQALEMRGRMDGRGMPAAPALSRPAAPAPGN